MIHDNQDVPCVQVNPGWIGFNLHFSNDSLTLLTAGEAYFYLGWSVIPLLGDRDLVRPKAPAIQWSSFQQYPAQLNVLSQWFQEDGFAGIGIVTGRVSRLVVLDFDSEAVFTRFSIQYPDLVETHTVRSAGRQLPHLYFHLPDHLQLDSQKAQGIDLLSNGRYVVAPPTAIAGQTYTITRGGMPKVLTERDIRCIQTFMNSCSAQPRVELIMKATPQPKAINKPIKTTPKDLQSIYRHLCQQGGRNEALFRTSLFARDTGWQPSEALNYLVALHSHQPSTSTHSKETPARRQHEARRTIQSAFSRPPRRNRVGRQATSGQLPNSVREALLQRKMTYLLRTLEGFGLAGLRPSQVFSMQQAEETLKGLVGRDSVHKALHAIAKGGETFFKRVSPAHPLQTAKAVASSKRQLNNKNCFLFPLNHQEKIGRGRPQHFYRMPSIADLCRLLGVKPSNSDPLDRTDLASAHQTRMALHRELLKRRPGQYTRRWLASRLGVTKPTINSYNRLIPIHSRPTYTETPIRWGNIERLPFDADGPLQGAFLVTRTGKKYPALRSIGSMLLAKREGVCLKERGGNVYWYGDAEPPNTLVTQIEEQVAEKQQAIESFLVQKKAIPRSEPFWERDSHPYQSVPEPVKEAKKPPKNVHKPLHDAQQEALAQYVYTTLNGEDKKTISLANARRLAVMQSESRVRAALNLVRQRKVVINPTGFLVSILQSKHHY